MASPAFTEQVEFQRYTTSADGAGGLKNTGSPVSQGLFIAEISERPYSKQTDVEKQTFRNVYQISIWNNQVYEPKEGDVCLFRGKNLIVQEIANDAFYRKILMRAVDKR